MVQRFLAAAAVVAALSLTACGGGGTTPSFSPPPTGGGATTAPAPTTAPPTTAPATTAPAPTAAATPASTPQTAAVAGSNAFVSSANGHTLYMFGADTPGVSNCNASNGCSSAWPPYGAPAGTIAPSGSGFSIITRSDGTLQWAFNGSPLYEFSGDSAAAQDNGQGLTEFGGLWTTARPATTSSTPAPSPTLTPYHTSVP